MLTFGRNGGGDVDVDVDVDDDGGDDDVFGIGQKQQMGILN